MFPIEHASFKVSLQIRYTIRLNTSGELLTFGANCVITYIVSIWFRMYYYRVSTQKTILIHWKRKKPGILWPNSVVFGHILTILGTIRFGQYIRVQYGEFERIRCGRQWWSIKAGVQSEEWWFSEKGYGTGHYWQGLRKNCSYIRYVQVHSKYQNWISVYGIFLICWFTFIKIHWIISYRYFREHNTGHIGLEDVPIHWQISRETNFGVSRLNGRYLRMNCFYVHQTLIEYS